MSATAAAPTRKRLFSVKLLVWFQVLLLLEVAAYVYIVDQTTGAFPLMKRLKWGKGAETVETKIAVLRSAQSAVRSGDRPAYYYDLAAYWEHQANTEGITFQTISDRQLEAGLDREINVLILPWAVCMSDAQRKVVRDFVKSGHGLVATGPMGARNADCSWHGWEFLEDMTGVKDLVSLTPEQQSFATFRGHQFYSNAVPAGLILDLPRHELAAGVADTPDIYLSDERWRPAGGRRPAEAAIAVHRRLENGRVVWLGFNERLVGSKLENGPQWFESYARAGIRWVAHEPLIAVANWPKRQQAAVLVSVEAGSDMAAAKAASGVCVEQNVPATVFLSKPPEPGEPLAGRYVEIGAGGDPNQPVSERNVFGQVQFLKDLKSSLEAGDELQITGFKPPQDLWDLDTMVAMRSSGYRYFLDHGTNHQAVPELFEFPSATWFGGKVEVAKISSGWSNDFEVVSEYKGPTPWTEELSRGFLDEFGWGLYLGGNYTLSIRSSLLGAPENLPILRSMLRHLKQQPVWFATGTQLSNWWSRRDKVRVEAQRVNQHRVRVSVVNRGREAVEDLSVYLHLPHRPTRIRLISEFIGRTPPQHTLEPNEDVLRLEFPRLNKESSQVFLVAMDES